MNKANRKMSTNNQLDLESLDTSRTMFKNFPGAHLHYLMINPCISLNLGTTWYKVSTIYYKGS